LPAISTILGTVRAQSSRDRDVIALEYEGYEEMAEAVMAEIASDVQERYDLCKVAMAHWLGASRSARRASRSGLRRTGKMRSRPAPTSIEALKAHVALEEGLLRRR